MRPPVRLQDRACSLQRVELGCFPAWAVLARPRAAQVASLAPRRLLSREGAVCRDGCPPQLRRVHLKEEGGHGPGRPCRSLFFTLVTGPRRSLSLNLSDAKVYAPQVRARLGTTAHFCEVVVLNVQVQPGTAGTAADEERRAAAERIVQANPKPSTLNPQPSTLNPQPSTLNPQPPPPNPQPPAPNPQPPTPNPQPPTPNPQPPAPNPQPQPPTPNPQPLNQTLHHQP